MDGSFTMFASSIANSQRCLLSVPFPAWAGTVLACGGEQGYSRVGWMRQFRQQTCGKCGTGSTRDQVTGLGRALSCHCLLAVAFVACTDVNYQVSVSIQTLCARGLRDEFGRDPVHWTRYGCGSGAVCVM